MALRKVSRRDTSAQAQLLMDLEEDHIRIVIEALEQRVRKHEEVLEIMREALEELEPAPTRDPKVIVQHPPKSSANGYAAEPTVPENNESITPLADEALSIGRTLGNPFTPTDLSARLDGESKRAYNWLAAWKRKGWIETCGFGQYRKTPTFGE